MTYVCLLLSRKLTLSDKETLKIGFFVRTQLAVRNRDPDSLL